MKKVLQLNASIFSDEGQSSRLADEFVAAWHKRARGELSVTRRDFALAPIPHLTAERFSAALTPAENRSPAQAQEAAIADELVNELLAAEVLVLGLPMYNFGVPSALKAWFDHVARAGTTFRYTAQGPEGLLKNKQAIVFAARGSVYDNNDFQTPYVKQFLGFLGITKVEFVYAEGLALGDEARRAALFAAGAAAGANIQRLAA